MVSQLIPVEPAASLTRTLDHDCSGRRQMTVEAGEPLGTSAVWRRTVRGRKVDQFGGVTLKLRRGVTRPAEMQRCLAPLHLAASESGLHPGHHLGDE